jgi:hypothetical protein
MRCEPTDGANLMQAELSRRLTFAMGMTGFGEHVRHIVLMGAEEEVTWVYAAPVVATMQNVEPWWDRAERQLISDAMRVQLATNVFVRLGVRADLSVAVAFDSAGPGPTLVVATSINLAPKARHKASLSPTNDCATGDNGDGLTLWCR